MFSKKKRIPRDIVKKVVSEGQKSYSELFLLKRLPNGLEQDRFAIVVSKKVSKTAVGRHKIKRKLKESLMEFYKNECNCEFTVENKICPGSDLQNRGHDFVILTSPSIKSSSYKNILEEIKKKNDFILK